VYSPRCDPLGSQNLQRLVLGPDPTEMRFTSPDGDQDLPWHAIAPLQAVEDGGPLLQEGSARPRKRGELAFRKVGSRALELRLALIIRHCCFARGLKLRKTPVQGDLGQGTIERRA
jgi:hypothetical protein